MLSLSPSRPWLALAPMQEITDLPYWRLLQKRGDPDLYCTDYIRVHPGTRPDREPLVRQLIEGNPTEKPCLVQLIGNDPVDLTRVARFVARNCPVQGVDLNLGCPAPKIFSKAAGGALLGDLEHLHRIFSEMREALDGSWFTVKTRLGIEDPNEFEDLLEVFAKHPLDALSIHGRTVQGRYRSSIHYEWIRVAAQRLPYPVFANGNVLGIESALETLRRTQARGVMVGRGVVRNPFLFRQLRAALEGEPREAITLRDLAHYIEDLYQTLGADQLAPIKVLGRVKKHLTFLGQGISDGVFLSEIRRTTDPSSFFALVHEHLDSSSPFPGEPPIESPVFRGQIGET